MAMPCLRPDVGHSRLQAVGLRAPVNGPQPDRPRRELAARLRQLCELADLTLDEVATELAAFQSHQDGRLHRR